MRADSRDDLDITSSHPELDQLPAQPGSAKVMLYGELGFSIVSRFMPFLSPPPFARQERMPQRRVCRRLRMSVPIWTNRQTYAT